MSGYELNYDFGDLLACASGLNMIAWMEFGEENIQVGHSHVKQQTIWETELEFLGRIIERNAALPDVDEETGDEAERADECSVWDMSLTRGISEEGPDNEEDDDGVDDLSIIGHETRHVLADVLQQVHSEGASVNKYDPMVVYEGHSIYKATLVSQLLGNPTLSKDRLTRIKQSIYFNGVQPKPRQEGVPICIMDIGSDRAVSFSTVRNQPSTRAKKGRRSSTSTKEVWTGRVQKIRRKYNGKWGKTRAEIDLLDRPVVQQGEGP
ncbi:hypothetical protein R1sor_024427 [Riccia sorocarpa]|uniref:Uncharacterized protein n=1 Tax=Riccia sorocarpa TaxID=122646 RepID=A0ABD3GS15_9MARC